MRIAVVWVAVLALASACKKNEAAKPATGSAGSAAAAAASDAAVAPEPGGGPAVLEMEDVDGESNPELLAAFGKQMPKLPAVNADATLLATLDDVSGGPAIPPAMQVTIRKFPSGDKTEELPILAYEEASNAGEAGDQWLTPELAKQLNARGKAIVAKLAGFHSLHDVKLEQDGTGRNFKPVKIGDVVFTAESSEDEALTIKLESATGKAIHRAHVDTYSQHETGDGIDETCTFKPLLNAVWTDPPKPRALYVSVGYAYRDGCGDASPDYFAWSTDPNSTTPAEAMYDVVTQQLDLVGVNSVEAEDIVIDDAALIGTNSVGTLADMKLFGVADHAMDYSDHADADVDITLSHDGKTAWASETAMVTLLETNKMGKDKPWRVSDMLVQTPKGWRISAMVWTEPTDNAKANKEAKAGKLTAQKLEGDAGDAGLNAAFAKLTTDGATNVAKDIIAIGSGPGERTVGAPAFVKPWNAAWKGKTTIVSSVARLAPSGTTGWVTATVELQKSGYKIPFTVFAVFDKDASDAWTLVHIHFAV